MFLIKNLLIRVLRLSFSASGFCSEDLHRSSLRNTTITNLLAKHECIVSDPVFWCACVNVVFSRGVIPLKLHNESGDIEYGSLIPLKLHNESGDIEYGSLGFVSDNPAVAFYYKNHNILGP